MIWEDLVEGEGVRTRGVVERPAYAGRGGGGGRGGGEREGTIRILLEDGEDEESGNKNGDNNENGDDDNDNGEKQKPQGALIRYSASDYQPKQVEDDDDNQGSSKEYSKQDFRSSKSSSNEKLSRGDIVDFILVSNRRSQLKYAREIGMIQSERERWEE